MRWVHGHGLLGGPACFDFIMYMFQIAETLRFRDFVLIPTINKGLSEVLKLKFERFVLMGKKPVTAVAGRNLMWVGCMVVDYIISYAYNC